MHSSWQTDRLLGRPACAHGIGWLVLALMLVATPAAAQRKPATDSIADLSGALETTARIAGPAVVQIFATSYTPGDGRVPGAADLVTTERASGSGVIVDADGYIVTNAHVVRGAQQVRVELPTGAVGRSILGPPRRPVQAQVVGLDVETDLAVLKVPERTAGALPFGDSDELRPGQLVLAVGSPLGLQNSVSLGVVSATARQLTPESPMVYVQTDASINPGSSGGPLVDLRGRVVGLNTLILSQSGGYEGVSLAAPSNIVRTVYEQIRKHGRVRRGDIGIRAQTVTPLLMAGLGLAEGDGVIVSDVVPRGMADRAGLQVGDVVVSLDGKTMENGRQLQVGLYRHYVGEVVTLQVRRGGRLMTFPVAIAERQDPFAGLTEAMDPRDHLVPRLGILGVTVDARVRALLPPLRAPGGVIVVTTVTSAIDTREGALESGDVIYALNRTPVTTLAELRSAVAALASGTPAVLHLERRGELMFLAFSTD